MGTYPVRIDDVVRNYKGYMVTGSGFTPYCHLLFNGKELSAQWVDPGHIQILEDIVAKEETEEPEETGEPVESASPAEAEEEKKEDVPNAFFIQVQSEGGTVLSESEILNYADTTLGKSSVPEE